MIELIGKTAAGRAGGGKEEKMATSLSEPARAIIAETLPLMEQHRAPLEKALERYMARHGPYDPSAGRTKVTTRAIMDMMLGRARQLGVNEAAVGIAQTARRHQTLAIGGEHYSCFGDGLKPIMKDVLGAEATSPVLAAWTDAYWASVRMLHQQQARLAA
jgi:hemoglobin-like flavoprotein